MTAAEISQSSATVELPPAFGHKFLLNVAPSLIQCAKVGVTIQSAEFDGDGQTWQLEVYLGGDSEEAKGHVSLSIKRLGGVAAKYDLAVSAFGVSYKDTDCQFEDGAYFWAWSKAVPHDAALPWLETNHGKVDITATVQTADQLAATVVPAPPAPLPLPVPSPSLPTELRTLLSSGAGADCALVCGDERFPAHTFVLSLRSRVFQAQLNRSSPLACDLNAVPVPPAVEPPVLRKLLEHVYTDEEVAFADVNEARLGFLHFGLAARRIRTAFNSQSNPLIRGVRSCLLSSLSQAQHLLNAADHYGMARLRALCERHLAAGLTVDNAAFTLTLADQHGAAGLRESAVRFICERAAEVVETEGWAHLQEARPQVAQEVLLSVVKAGGGGGGGAAGRKRGREAALGGAQEDAAQPAAARRR